MDERLLERNRHDELRRAQGLVAAVAVATIARLANDDGSRHTRESPREQPSGNDLLAECLRELDPLFYMVPGLSTLFAAAPHQSQGFLADNEGALPRRPGGTPGTRPSRTPTP